MTSLTLKKDAEQRLPLGDPLLFIAVVALTTVGTLFVYSSSAFIHGDQFFFLKRQLLYVALCFAAMYAGYAVDYNRYKEYCFFIFIGAFFLVVLVLIPGVTSAKLGAKRWIPIPGLGFTFQPSEFAKVAFIIYVSWALARIKDASKIGVVGIFQALWPAMLLILIIAVEPDLGCALVLFAVAIALLIVAGTRIRYLVYIGAPLLAVAVFAMSRMEKFNHIWKRLEIGASNLNSMVNKIDQVGAGEGAYQIKESIISFGSGGLDGMGLGMGPHKLYFLPQVHSDFILATIGQETGFYGFCFVMLVYLIFLYKGFSVAWKSSDNFASYLAFGISALFAMQIFVNAGVVMGMLPPKGIVLPFLSYGGTAMISMGFMAGILLHLSRRVEAERAKGLKK